MNPLQPLTKSSGITGAPLEAHPERQPLKLELEPNERAYRKADRASLNCPRLGRCNETLTGGAERGECDGTAEQSSSQAVGNEGKACGINTHAFLQPLSGDEAAQAIYFDAQIDALKADSPVLTALEAFRNEWWHCKQRGYRFAAKLPALSHHQASIAHDDTTDYYYRGGRSADLRVSKKLAEDTRAAIVAAEAEYQAGKSRPNRKAELRALIRERDGNDCWVCGHELRDDATIEHRIALANGGTWAFDNLALAHRECNRDLGRLPAAAKDAVRALIAAENGPRIDADWEMG